MEIKCLPSKPDKADIDIARFAIANEEEEDPPKEETTLLLFFVKVSAAKRATGWFRHRRDDNILLLYGIIDIEAARGFLSQRSCDDWMERGDKNAKMQYPPQNHLK